MEDIGGTVIDFDKNTLREIEFLDSTTLKITYLINTITIRNRLDYSTTDTARKIYNELLLSIMPSKDFLIG
jgi:hypothetical protein